MGVMTGDSQLFIEHFIALMNTYTWTRLTILGRFPRTRNNKLKLTRTISSPNTNKINDIWFAVRAWIRITDST